MNFKNIKGGIPKSDAGGGNGDIDNDGRCTRWNDNLLWCGEVGAVQVEAQCCLLSICKRRLDIECRLIPFHYSQYLFFNHCLIP